MDTPDISYQTQLDRVSLRALGKHLESAGRAATAARTGRGTDFDRVIEMGEQIAALVDNAKKAQAYWAVVAGSAGASWTQIGESAGIGRMTAYQRWKGLMQATPLPDVG